MSFAHVLKMFGLVTYQDHQKELSNREASIQELNQDLVKVKSELAGAKKCIGGLMLDAESVNSSDTVRKIACEMRSGKEVSDDDISLGLNAIHVVIDTASIQSTLSK